MKHASLFSGIGGFDLAAQWAGWDNVFQCEIDPFCQKVLQYHFPNTELYNDIKQTDFSKYYGAIDVVSGGFPCQPFSIAGKRKGTADDRYLWHEMFRAIREISPRYIVAENVLGIVNWSKGLVFEQVCLDLEIERYEIQPFIIPACGINAPHQRYRTWFIAHATSRRGGGRRDFCNIEKEKQENRNIGIFGKFEGFSQERTTANTDNRRTRGLSNKSKEKGTQHCDELLGKQCTIPNWDNFPTQSPICSRNDGISRELDSITFSKWRSESIKAYGNAVVPQIPYQIFNAINNYENQQKINKNDTI
jgi:DNA (cytosine-5)-methyltransferase 1